MAHEAGSLYFIGNATVLIRYAGFTVLTDPNFLHQGEHVHLGYGLRSRRRTDPAMAIEGLPPLDVVVLSHLHDDHFDRIAEERLDRAVPIVTTRHAATRLGAKGFRDARALATWGSATFTRDGATLRVTSMPGQHTPLAMMQPLLPPVMGSLLEFDDGGGPPLRMYISGDTLMHGRLEEIPRRYPDIDMALLHLGGTRVFGVMLTMDGAQGVRLLQLVDPATAVPIHYDDYEAFKSPLEDFRREVERAGLAGRVRYVARGEQVALPPASA